MYGQILSDNRDFSFLYRLFPFCLYLLFINFAVQSILEEYERISINDIKSHCSVILLTLAMIFAFSLNVSARDRLVQRGMTKEEVVVCLGRPVATSFNQYGELWTYKKVPWLGAE